MYFLQSVFVFNYILMDYLKKKKKKKKKKMPVSGIELRPFWSRNQRFTADPYHHLSNLDKNFLQYCVSINMRV